MAPSPPPEYDTRDYYNRNVYDFIERSLHLDLADLYTPFLKLLPRGAHILDAGCGSGRDTLYFLQHGYRVTAMDASEAMVRSAAKLTGLDVQQKRFEDVDFIELFNGIWACASLLHVPDANMERVLNNLSTALKPGGVFYLSFKYGRGETFRDGRFFNDFDETRFSALMGGHPQLQVISVWESGSLRADRKNEAWLNAIVSKMGSSKETGAV